VRTLDPSANPALNQEALNNLKAAWPVFAGAEIAEAWAGTIDVTPDSNPVIGPLAKIRSDFGDGLFRPWLWHFTGCRTAGGGSGVRR
jgi:glycine/D-amino acid oxidase-like deaminating enzyme